MVTINREYHKAARKLILVYILNIADLAFTVYLLKTGNFAEANPVLGDIILKPEWIIPIKLVLVGTLIAWMLFRMKKATIKQLILSNRIIGIIADLYLAVNVMHIFWTVRGFTTNI